MSKWGKLATAETTIDVAWQLCEERPELSESFRECAARGDWPNKEFEPQPFWAYWFARQIICDHWPLAESLIYEDDVAASYYNDIVELYRRLGTLNHTICVPEPVEMGPEEPRKPLTHAERRLVADNAEEAIEAYRRQKRQKRFEDLPDDEDLLGGDE